MLDFEVQRCTRRCAKTDRELQPGEDFYSVLVAEGAEVVRKDYAVESWEGAPDAAIGFWKSKVPAANAKKINWAPNDVMLDYFVRIENDEAKQDVRYVLALLLLRRKVLRLEETDSSSTDVLHLHCPRNETEYQVKELSPSNERVKEIQDELAALLFGN